MKSFRRSVCLGRLANIRHMLNVSFWTGKVKLALMTRYRKFLEWSSHLPEFTTHALILSIDSSDKRTDPFGLCFFSEPIARCASISTHA